MCGNVFKVMPRNKLAPHKYLCTCSKCKSCRTREQSAWNFRLRAELEDCHKKGWRIGFLTLTYCNDSLPVIPDTSFHCFDKNQCREFIVRLRKYLFDHYKITSIKYMLVSEFGKSTQRPHYHMIISWPKELLADELHAIIKSLWPFGHIFPRYSSGGKDSHGYEHMPFEVTSNPSGAVRYIAKYVCKDLDFFESIKTYFSSENDVTDDIKRNCFPFHIQSKSLGLNRFKNLDFDTIFHLIKDGFNFVGDDKTYTIPLYLKRKFFFNPDYIYERKIYKGIRLQEDLGIFQNLSNEELEKLGYSVVVKRVVGRKATDFLKQNYHRLYDLTLNNYTRFFEKLLSGDYLKNLGFEEHSINAFHDSLDDLSFGSPSHLAQFYLTIYGKDYSKAYNVDPPLAWYLRYDDSIDTSDFVKFPPEFLDVINSCLDVVLSFSSLYTPQYTDLDGIVDMIRDFIKSTPY